MAELRVLHCPTMVAGNPQQLARAERNLGLQSWSVAFRESPFAYKTDEILFAKGDGKLRCEFKRWNLLRRAMCDFDIVHFNFGQSIMPQWVSGVTGRDRGLVARTIMRGYTGLVEMSDVALLRYWGKGVFVTYQGDDARQGDYCKQNYEINFVDEVQQGYYSEKTDRKKRQRIRLFARYCHGSFAVNPDLMNVLPDDTTFMPYCHIDLAEWSVVEKEASKRLTVLHAPSHRGVKGTRYIVEAVSRLKQEGLDFEFIMVENMTNAEAKKIYEKADILIDQLLAGWYGGLAVELMAMGKPVICYLRETDLKFLNPEMRRELPIINATPETVIQVLRDCLTDRRNELAMLGTRSRSYVERWHDPRKIAAQMKQEYERATRKSAKVE